MTAGGLKANLAFLKTMLENARKNAPTAKQRQEAAQALADLEHSKAELEQQSADMDAMQPEIAQIQAQAPAGEGMASEGVTRMTRIADTCATAGK